LKDFSSLLVGGELIDEDLSSGVEELFVSWKQEEQSLFGRTKSLFERGGVARFSGKRKSFNS